MDQAFNSNRRNFLKTTGGLTGGLYLAADAEAAARPLTQKEKLDRIASNTWPIRYIFKSRASWGASSSQRVQEMKKKYGEITMLDFPTFTKETFPGVTRMDLFSGLFGDMSDDSMYVAAQIHVGEVIRSTQEFDQLFRKEVAGRRRDTWRQVDAGE